MIDPVNRISGNIVDIVNRNIFPGTIEMFHREVSKRYTELARFAKELSSQFRAPFMALSFMALLVIPEIKLSDKGLFDVSRFEFMDLFTS